MLNSLDSINNRKLLYLEVIFPFTESEQLPVDNWLAFVIADLPQLPLLYNFAQICLDKKTRYVCGAGAAASQIDDAFDFAIVDQKLKTTDRELTSDDFEDTPVTTWHEHLDEGLWFAAFSAYLPDEPIDTIVVFNLTSVSYEKEIQLLASRLNDGWVPEDQRPA